MKHKIEVEIEKIVLEKETKEVSTSEYIGIKIKEKRLKLGFSQSDLAEKLSFSRQNLSNLESGRFNATLLSIEEICQVFKCKSSDILPF